MQSYRHRSGCASLKVGTVLKRSCTRAIFYLFDVIQSHSLTCPKTLTKHCTIYETSVSVEGLNWPHIDPIFGTMA